MNISTVNELIQSLESAGELSIKERKYLELARAFKQLAAENVAMKGGPQGFFAYGSECGYEEFDTAEEATKFAEAEIADFRGQACDGWSDEVGSVVWGIVMQRASMTGLRPVTEDDNVPSHIEECCDYTLLPSVETPATDLIVAGIKADGSQPMTKSTITREQLLEIIETDHVQCGEASYLARMALAAMDSEPNRNPVLAYADSYRDMEKQGVESVPIWSVITDLERNIAPLYRHAQQPVVPEGLNPETTDLVLRFASALADKLYKAEQKYGRSTDWMKDDWYDDCLQSLWEHIEKGDPRDVAAYCAFMWYHGWVTTDYDRNVQNACRAAMLAPAPQEVK